MKSKDMKTNMELIIFSNSAVEDIIHMMPTNLYITHHTSHLAAQHNRDVHSNLSVSLGQPKKIVQSKPSKFSKPCFHYDFTSIYKACRKL